MSSRTISGDTPSTTSSPASADGVTLFDLPDGTTLAPSGPAVVLASPFRGRARERPELTNGISGRCGFGSSASVALSESLANRLRARLGLAGGIEFQQIWK